MARIKSLQNPKEFASEGDSWLDPDGSNERVLFKGEWVNPTPPVPPVPPVPIIPEDPK